MRKELPHAVRVSEPSAAELMLRANLLGARLAASGGGPAPATTRAAGSGTTNAAAAAGVAAADDWLLNDNPTLYEQRPLARTNTNNKPDLRYGGAAAAGMGLLPRTHSDGGDTKAPAVTWDCARCTFTNTGTGTRCAMCDSFRGNNNNDGDLLRTSTADGGPAVVPLPKGPTTQAERLQHAYATVYAEAAAADARYAERKQQQQHQQQRGVGDEKKKAASPANATANTANKPVAAAAPVPVPAPRTTVAVTTAALGAAAAAEAATVAAPDVPQQQQPQQPYVSIFNPPPRRAARRPVPPQPRGAAVQRYGPLLRPPHPSAVTAAAAHYSDADAAFAGASALLDTCSADLNGLLTQGLVLPDPVVAETAVTMMDGPATNYPHSGDAAVVVDAARDHDEPPVDVHVAQAMYPNQTTANLTVKVLEALTALGTPGVVVYDDRSERDAYDWLVGLLLHHGLLWQLVLRKGVCHPVLVTCMHRNALLCDALLAHADRYPGALNVNVLLQGLPLTSAQERARAAYQFLVACYTPPLGTPLALCRRVCAWIRARVSDATLRPCHVVRRFMAHVLLAWRIDVFAAPRLRAAYCLSDDEPPGDVLRRMMAAVLTDPAATVAGTTHDDHMRLPLRVVRDMQLLQNERQHVHAVAAAAAADAQTVAASVTAAAAAAAAAAVSAGGGGPAVWWLDDAVPADAVVTGDVFDECEAGVVAGTCKCHDLRVVRDIVCHIVAPRVSSANAPTTGAANHNNTNNVLGMACDDPDLELFADVLTAEITKRGGSATTTTGSAAPVLLFGLCASARRATLQALDAIQRARARVYLSQLQADRRAFSSSSSSSGAGAASSGFAALPDELLRLVVEYMLWTAAPPFVRAKSAPN